MAVPPSAPPPHLGLWGACAPPGPYGRYAPAPELFDAHYSRAHAPVCGSERWPNCSHAARLILAIILTHAFRSRSAPMAIRSRNLHISSSELVN